MLIHIYIYICILHGGAVGHDEAAVARLGIHYRGLQWEGGAVDWGSIM